jgi:hypothetical protein
MSCVWLPERPSASGLPTHRRLRGFFVVRPPRERPMAWSQPLFTGASAVLVRPDDGSVDHRVFVVRIIGQGLEKTLPNPTRGPARKCLWVFFQPPKRSGNRAKGRLNGISRSPPRQTGGCQVRYCGQPYRDGRQQCLNSRKLVAAQSVALHHKASQRRLPMNHALNDLRILEMTSGPSSFRRRVTERRPRFWILNSIGSEVLRTSPTVFRPAAISARLIAGWSLI